MKNEKVYFIRHNLDNSDTANRLCTGELIAIFFGIEKPDDVFSVVDGKYTVIETKLKGKNRQQCRTAVSYFAELANDGGLVVAEYNGGNIASGSESSFYGAKVGRVEKNSQIISHDGAPICLKLTDVKSLKYADFPVMLAVRPPFVTICVPDSNLFKDIIPNWFSDTPIKEISYGMLHYKMTEQMCVEYMLKHDETNSEIKLNYCILRPGKNAPLFDIAGIDTCGKKVYASVKFNRCPIDVVKELAKFADCNDDCNVILFSDDEIHPCTVLGIKSRLKHKNTNQIFILFKQLNPTMLRHMIGIPKKMFAEFQ
jgi:hypothetical protein